jgi:hypothetical protein
MLETKSSNSSMQPFKELGDLVESRWRDQNYNEELLPRIAAQALAEVNPSARVDPWEIIQWFHTTPDLPQQMDLEANFGDPPLTLYVGPRFFIDVYYWLDGTTSIHQHSFSGAFQVLLGGSVHTHYRFEKHREINQHFQVGRILPGEVSLLQRGDIREIIPGPEFMHSLFHLERPSATITIRNYKTFAAAVQYSYLKPSVAYDPFFSDAALKRKLQTVKLLLGMKHPQADRFLEELITSADFQTAYAVLEFAFEFLCHRELEELVGATRSRDRFESLVARARAKHGEVVDLLPPVFEESWREKEISRRRSLIKGEDHRFFMALLLNVRDRKTLLRLVQEKFPEQEPTDLIIGWVRELAATRVFGSHEPNVLGIGDFDDRQLAVLRGLLAGNSEAEIQAACESQPLTASAPQQTFPEIAARIAALPLFKAIFTTAQ